MADEGSDHQDMTAATISDAERRSDIAWKLTAEFAQWYGRLGTKGEIPFAFSGVTTAGRQVVIILSGLPFDHVQRREFLIWLCRAEHMIAYVYGTHVAWAKEGEEPTEGLALYASSPRFDVRSMFAVLRGSLDRIDYQAINADVLDAGGEGGSVIYHGLQRSTEAISDEAAQRYAETWMMLKPRCMWRDLRGTAH